MLPRILADEVDLIRAVVPLLRDDDDAIYDAMDLFRVHNRYNVSDYDPADDFYFVVDLKDKLLDMTMEEVQAMAGEITIGECQFLVTALLIINDDDFLRHEIFGRMPEEFNLDNILGAERTLHMLAWKLDELATACLTGVFELSSPPPCRGPPLTTAAAPPCRGRPVTTAAAPLNNVGGDEDVDEDEDEDEGEDADEEEDEDEWNVAEVTDGDGDKAEDEDEDEDEDEWYVTVITDDHGNVVVVTEESVGGWIML